MSLIERCGWLHVTAALWMAFLHCPLPRTTVIQLLSSNSAFLMALLMQSEPPQVHPSSVTFSWCTYAILPTTTMIKCAALPSYIENTMSSEPISFRCLHVADSYFISCHGCIIVAIGCKIALVICCWESLLQSMIYCSFYHLYIIQMMNLFP